MKTPGCKASLEAKSSFSGTAELPPKKRTLDRGKAVLSEPPERDHPDLNFSKLPSITLDKGKACPDQEPPKADIEPETTLKRTEPEPSFNIYLHSNEGGEGESSSLTPLPPFPAPRRRPIVCKFCGQQFSTTQALGGHQNAHKQEREMQRMMKAAHEFRTSPFLYNLPSLYHGPYLGRHSQYPPYHGYAQRGWQPRPIYFHPRPGLAYSPPGLGRAAFGPGWPLPHSHATGPIKSPRSTTNFNPLAASNLTTFLHAMEESGPSKKQRVESIGLNLSHKCGESAMLDVLPKCNGSSDLESPENPHY